MHERVSSLSSRVSRLRHWFRAGRRLASTEDPIGRRAHELLPRTTQLSPQGVRYALDRCLEAVPTDAELRRVCGKIAEAPRVHVLLSANVFTAPLRAIALAFAASEKVCVRASRREPLTASLLHQVSGGAFELVDELLPKPGEHVWAYGSDETLARVSRRWSRGVVLHPHGFGFGVVVLDEAMLNADSGLPRRLAEDIIAFDQRGCLSPRIAFVNAPLSSTREFAWALMRELEEFQRSIPLGRLTPEEAADSVRFRDCMTFAANDCLQSEAGSVAIVERPERYGIPPIGRNLLLACDMDLEQALLPIQQHVTQVGTACSAAVLGRLKRALPLARLAPVGNMQRPPFDGPVDRRASPRLLGASSSFRLD